MTKHSTATAEPIRDLDVAASEADDVKGGRPMDDEIEYLGGDSEQPYPSGPGLNTGGGFISSIADSLGKRPSR